MGVGCVSGCGLRVSGWVVMVKIEKIKIIITITLTITTRTHTQPPTVRKLAHM